VLCFSVSLCLCGELIRVLPTTKDQRPTTFSLMPETTLESQTETDLKSLAQDIVRRAMQHGATAAECVIREGDEFSTLVRLGQVETLKESGSKAIGIRVFF